MLYKEMSVIMARCEESSVGGINTYAIVVVKYVEYTRY